MQKFNLNEVTKVIHVETQESVPQNDWLESILTSTVTLHGNKGQYALIENGTVEYVKGFFGASLQYFVTTLKKYTALQTELRYLENILEGFNYPTEEVVSVYLGQVYVGMTIVMSNGRSAVIEDIDYSLDSYRLKFKDDTLTYGYNYDGRYLKGREHAFDIVVVMD